MMKFLIILLDANCPSYCAYEKSEVQKGQMPIEILKKGIHYALIENLYVQVIYPDYVLNEEYMAVLDSVNKIGMASVWSQNVDFADVLIVEDWDDLRELKCTPEGMYILRSSKESLFEQYAFLKDFIKNVRRVNIFLTDIDTFTNKDFTRYKDVLREISDSIVERFHNEVILSEINLLTDRITLNQMNNCNAGIDSITLAPDGNFYLCPAFFYEEKSIGDIYSGLCIKNSQLLKIDNAPICCKCDAYQCKRCIWLNKKKTLEINTPSHEQCVVSHIERNASRELLIQLKKCGFQSDSKLKKINYLDPFERFFADRTSYQRYLR